MKHGLLLFVGILLLSCNGLKSVKQVLLPRSPYEEYVQSLSKAGLKDRPLASAWIKAGEHALTDSIVLLLPFSETGFFEAAKPQARGYRFQVRAGQVLRITGHSRSLASAKFFADLYVLENNQWEELLHADTSLSLTHEFNKEQWCLLRIQPELLVDVWYQLIITSKPSLINPVKGATNKSIGSFYGNSRDNGARLHEGVDIFAPRGTPVIAPANGVVYSTATNRLGGKVIWLYDTQRNQTYYFAHLDSQWVNVSLTVKQGDTLGQVGNTGNAMHTAPHLHFGIYKNGSTDPLHYIQTTSDLPSEKIDSAFQPTLYTIARKEAALRCGPSSGSQVIHTVLKHTLVKCLAKSAAWCRVELPNKEQAYISPRDLTTLKAKKYILSKADTLWSEADSLSLPIQTLSASEQLEVLGEYNGYDYIQTSTRQQGWMKQHD